MIKQCSVHRPVGKRSRTGRIGTGKRMRKHVVRTMNIRAPLVDQIRVTVVHRVRRVNVMKTILRLLLSARKIRGVLAMVVVMITTRSTRTVLTIARRAQRRFGCQRANLDIHRVRIFLVNRPDCDRVAVVFGHGSFV